jgi:L-lactate dehydrogenase
VPAEFWNRAYNISSGEQYRMTNYEFETRLLNGLGLPGPEKVFEPQWFALKNFHGMWYTDADDLENFLHFSANIPIDEYHSVISSSNNIYPPLKHSEVEEYMRKSGGRVIQRKGATFYAVSLSVCHICKSLINGMDTTMTVSSMMHGEYGIDDVCLSTLNVIGRDGITGKLHPKLTDEETVLLRKSADCLKDIIRNLEI